MGRVLDENEIVRLTPVWWAFSELFLDTEHATNWLEKLAASLADSGYSVTELHDIFCKEVTPAFFLNMLSAVGEWQGWDQDWVRDRVLAYQAKAGIAQWLDLQASRLVRPEKIWRGFYPYLSSAFQNSPQRTESKAGH